MSGTIDDGVVVAVTGPVTCAEVERWRVAILDGLAKSSSLRIDLSGSGPWDTAGLQLILSALETARKRRLKVRLIRVPRVFLTIVERAGLSDHCGAVDVVESLA